MWRDTERVERIQDSLRAANLDLLVCALPQNVLLVSGYWPVVGTSLALVTRDGFVLLLVPHDEHELAVESWADSIIDFHPASLDDLRGAVEGIHEPLHKVAKELGVGSGSIGIESESAFNPSSYASMHIFNDSLRALLSDVFPHMNPKPADALLARLRSVKTSRELDYIRIACRVASQAFAQGAEMLLPGLTEPEIAYSFQKPLSTHSLTLPNVARSGGFVYCMSGPNSAKAGAAYARTRGRQTASNDLVLLHCNSYLDGYWTDITRTYCLDAPNNRQEKMLEAVLTARSAALATIRPGIPAAAVDRAAREVLQARGFGKQFPHAVGHGVGFAAIDHQAIPYLHPKSTEVLEEGMVFNVEPAIYLPDCDGLRHCDMVAVTSSGAEVLTPFQTTTEQLVLAEERRPAASGEILRFPSTH